MTRAQEKQNKNALPINVNDALRELVRLSNKLVMFTDQETQSLVINDHLRFAYIQRDKERTALQYTKASEEFRSRLEEFRNGDKGLLMQLDRSQKELKQKSESNNILIEQIKNRAQANTTSTLFTVQEMGQRVRFPTTDHESAAQKGALR
ncbi:MAG: hypothetical protein ACRBCK_05120 [Alphaproteobacteria bacterium]